MLKRIIMPAAAALLFGALAAAPEPAAASWVSVPAAVNQTNALNLSDVVEVRRRGRVVVRPHVVVRPRVVRRGFVAAPFIAAPIYGAARCGWVWSPRRARNIWRCW